MTTLQVERRDEQIVCVDCERVFTWTEAGQLFFERKGFARPKRCRTCRDAHRLAKIEAADRRD